MRRVPGCGRQDAAQVLLFTVVGAGACALGGMWFAQTSALHDLGGYLVAAGRLAGLMAGYATLVLVGLMARIPTLERAVGADRLARWHALVGRWALVLLATHVASIAGGYALAARVSLWAESVVLIRSYPDVVTAVIAASLLAGVGIASAARIRPSLRYETWYVTHLMTYAAILLALAHQLADGVDFVYHPVERMAWIALYASVGALVVWFRALRPAWQALCQRTVVSSVVKESADVVVVTLRGRRVERLGAEAGQFFRLRFLQRGLWWQSHPFSLSAPPVPPHLEFAVKAAGDFTRGIRDVVPGTLVVAEGPFGALTVRRQRRHKALLIAGGIGIAPVRALFESLPARGGDVTLLYRCRSEADIAFRAELDGVAAARGATVVYICGRTVDIGDPLSSEALAGRFPDLPERDVFLCGPPPMMARASVALRGAGVPRNQVHFESYSLFGPPLSRPRRAVLCLTTVSVLAVLLVLRTSAATSSFVRTRTAVGPATPEVPTGRGPAAARTVVGPAERTLFSTVQVEVRMAGGRLTDVRAVSLPNLDAHSRQLSEIAAPILRREALATNGDDIQSVSGATYTSGAYALSLQGAMDAAND